MVKTINETFSDSDFEMIKKAKGNLSWSTWILSSARDQLEETK